MRIVLRHGRGSGECLLGIWRGGVISRVFWHHGNGTLCGFDLMKKGLMSEVCAGGSEKKPEGVISRELGSLAEEKKG